MGDFENIRTKPSCPEYRKAFNKIFNEPFGDNSGLPKGGKKIYSMEDLRKDGELAEAAKKRLLKRKL